MTNKSCEDEDFINLIATIGPSQTARRIGITERSTYTRIKNIEAKLGQKLPRPNKPVSPKETVPGRLEIEVTDGMVVIGSDAHYWPGVISTAHKALVKFCELNRHKIKAVVMNGDVFDGSSISRFAPIGWESRPTVQQEIETCQARLWEIQQAAPDAERYWPLGNHDARLESRIAQQAPEFAMVKGVHLKDHFEAWKGCWSLWINDEVVIKHRFKGGVHATHNNTVTSGKSMVTGHLHSQKVTPITDYNGDRWGVDCGTMAEIFGPQFTGYMEDSPRNWRSGFAVLTFVDGELLQPELVRVIRPGVVDFRGRRWDV
ncbi:Calcineurin-like phosphoesterase domain, ApaH type [uncultured Caudovirales phage]|uniref:Calcineurin-like phosphoesterase domain, ApaH type n=1 Tax=uncultured Caudovirales phage TaxID=2100421 RepID=A0A6J5T6M2_9CAUD|nr:Calcineurin-like phosphoesterase domain, ApaH type [uncultured Caudovirales phage]CAB4210958.1 Calcineurin-like phosphoesterase domain, ApaH type [uncultured Caudovirales phage]CAB4223382.1 Calcineurin-like phosphoesterase domain, ApaH type [uncultured Caudovirales phage]